jgi:hypothetical protein
LVAEAKAGSPAARTRMQSCEREEGGVPGRPKRAAGPSAPGDTGPQMRFCRVTDACGAVTPGAAVPCRRRRDRFGACSFPMFRLASVAVIGPLRVRGGACALVS